MMPIENLLFIQTLFHVFSQSLSIFESFIAVCTNIGMLLLKMPFQITFKSKVFITEFAFDFFTMDYMILNIINTCKRLITF